MDAYRVVEVELHPFLTLEICASVWKTLRPGRFTPGKVLGYHYIDGLATVIIIIIIIIIIITIHVLSRTYILRYMKRYRQLVPS
jgi:hypothetical protein